MNTKRPLGIWVILVLAIFSGQAQSRYQFGLLPSLNFNKKLAQDFSLNAKVESRQELKDGFFNTPADFSYDYLLTDLSLLVAKKFRSNQSIGFGYLLRLEEGKTILRSIQQYTVTRAYSSFRLAHRLIPKSSNFSGFFSIKLYLFSCYYFITSFYNCFVI